MFFYFHVSLSPHIPAAFRLVPQSCTSVHSIVTKRNPAHAMRPCRQHLLLNKLLITKNVRRPLMNMLND